MAKELLKLVIETVREACSAFSGLSFSVASKSSSSQKNLPTQARLGGMGVGGIPPHPGAEEMPGQKAWAALCAGNEKSVNFPKVRFWCV